MCTLTLIPDEQGYTLTMNRDELRSRDEAGLHRARIGSVYASFPVDAVAGGTWVGLNSQGVSLALLNCYQAPSVNVSSSRGNIIAKAIFGGTATEIYLSLTRLDVERYNPFDLVLVDRGRVHQFRWDRVEYHWRSRTFSKPLMFTSSSERLVQVEAYRKAQFSTWLDSGNSSREITQFHLSQEASRASDAVLMDREQVHTKSLVQIRVDSRVATLSYFNTETLSANRKLPETATASSKFFLNNRLEALEILA